MIKRTPLNFNFPTPQKTTTYNILPWHLSPSVCCVYLICILGILYLSTIIVYSPCTVHIFLPFPHHPSIYIVIHLMIHFYLKRPCHEIFWNSFSLIQPIWVPDKQSKMVSLKNSFSRRYLQKT